MDRPKLVIDTNVLVSALRSRLGSSFRLLALLRSGAYRISMSVPLILEYEDVLKRAPSLIPISPAAVDDILDQLCAVADLRDIYFLWRPVLQDP